MDDNRKHTLPQYLHSRHIIDKRAVRRPDIVLIFRVRGDRKLPKAFVPGLGESESSDYFWASKNRLIGRFLVPKRPTARGRMYGGWDLPCVVPDPNSVLGSRVGFGLYSRHHATHVEVCPLACGLSMARLTPKDTVLLLVEAKMRGWRCP